MQLVNSTDKRYRFRLSSSIVDIKPGESMELSESEGEELKDNAGFLSITGMSITNDSISTIDREAAQQDSVEPPTKATRRNSSNS